MRRLSLIRMSRLRRASAAGAALIALAAAAGFAGLPPASAATSTVTCRSAGLRVTYHSGNVTFSNKVESLRATAVSCATARDIAAVTAKRLLHHNSVTPKVDGFRVHVKSPCSACAPVWHVRATAGRSKITFTLMGGA